MRDVGSTALAVALAAALGSAGCISWRKTTWELGMGGFGMELLVARLDERGPYLDAILAGHGLHLRTFVPASDVCRAVLRPDSTVEYVERGVGGRFEREGQSCDSVGFGDPLIRRARQPRAGSLQAVPVPRAQATFRTLYEDADVVLLRGRFPLALTIGWTGGDDTVAVVGNVARCRGPVEARVASMEYRPAGPNTLALVGDEGLCRIEGLIQPPGPVEENEARQDGGSVSGGG
jgi:hypothetical protein